MKTPFKYKSDNKIRYNFNFISNYSNRIKKKIDADAFRSF